MSETALKPVSPILVSLVVSLAAFMEVLDTTIANVALSHIAGSLGAGSEESTWVLTSYLVSNGIVLPLSGWLSGLMGRKNFFILCIVGFTVTSFMCGISTSLPMLIVFRLLQGLAGGGLQPAQQAIIKDSFPPEKLGMAFAITGITTVLAPILGPTLGGYITDNYSWRWIFFMNVPVGLLAAFLVKILVQDPPSAQKQNVGSIDYIGLGLIAVGLGALQIVLDKGQQEDWFDSSFIVFFATISVISLIVAIYWLLQQERPVVELKLFKIPSFGMPCVMMFFVGFALYGSTTLLPMMVQSNFGYDATLSGLLLSPAGVVVLFMMPVVGRLVNRVPAKYLISLGMLINALGMWATGLVTPQTDYATFVFVRILQTLGLPFLFVPASTLAFSKISPQHSSNASAIISLTRNLGGSIGIALVTNKLIHSQQIEQSYLVQHLTMADAGYRYALETYTQAMTNLGVPAALASTQAMGKIYQELLHQASILAYRDAYNFVASLLVVLGIAALFMPDNKPQKQEAPAASH
ncbi:DHA2 family efflux MFS transporter permease subunit [Sporomusa acidovorans]|uniref:Multidrug export protein EmrB n=1 Tax=Sporomusa acidovorans (strain ATCC 49682 / DSM 3132 / Mol) TaxID=1123286 RepID=A0ABZ3IXB4_SPOA4|nr:DHA2 family efflux MFS transporter permease subunit [Sporomusa acidovorans]OZC15847.1 multidrug export protein EmrB [Sporomusa acidovorans DSM 3132]SDF29601.1 MFS transporter, DHA2 family, multidrug resistance protein [Sporomusa acidovorans]